MRSKLSKKLAKDSARKQKSGNACKLVMHTKLGTLIDLISTHKSPSIRPPAFEETVKIQPESSYLELERRLKNWKQNKSLFGLIWFILSIWFSVQTLLDLIGSDYFSEYFSLSCSSSASFASGWVQFELNCDELYYYSTRLEMLIQTNSGQAKNPVKKSSKTWRSRCYQQFYNYWW